jgi:hypothetical protein
MNITSGNFFWIQNVLNVPQHNEVPNHNKKKTERSRDLYSGFRPYMAHVLQMVHITPPCNDHWCLNMCPSLTPRLVLWRRRNWCQVADQGVTACFMSTSVASRLPARCVLSGWRSWLWLEPILPAGHVTGYGAVAGRLWTTFPRVSI